MGAGDILDNYKDHDLEEAKEGFFERIAFLEEHLDEAERLGKARDFEMLEVLEEVEEMQKETAEYSKVVGESTSLTNSKVRKGKIIEKYLYSVLEDEIEDISAGIKRYEGHAKNLPERIESMKNTIEFYGELYPELGLEKLREKLEQFDEGK